MVVEPLAQSCRCNGGLKVVCRVYRYAWIAVEDPTLLDYPNAEMVLIGERADRERALLLSRI